MHSVILSLENIFQSALTFTPNGYFEHLHDPEWKSPCEIGNPDQAGNIYWKPLRRDHCQDFSGLESALGVSLHEDIKTYFGSYYSDPVYAQSKEGPLCLLQIWNERDYGRLVENLVGHYLMKKSRKDPLTVFFATAEDGSELFLSIDNSDGRILLEDPGRGPIREVESDLTTFLNRLEPVNHAAQLK